jgi:hypothetical protein
MFRILFCYALLRGLGDAITRRPDLFKRLVVVEYRQAKRVMLSGDEEYRQAYFQAAKGYKPVWIKE